MNDISRETVISTLKIAISVGCIVYLYYTVPFEQLWIAMSEFSPVQLLLIFAVVIIRVLFNSEALRALIPSDISRWMAIKINSIASVANSFIPSRAGILVAAPFLLEHYADISKSTGFKIQGIRLVILAGFQAAIATIGLLMTYDHFSFGLIAVILTSIGLYVGVIVAALLGPRLLPRVRSYLPEMLNILTESTNEQIGLNAVVMGAIFTILGFAAVIIRFGIIATAIGTSFPIYWYVFLPFLIYIVTILPISFGGIGLAESSGVIVMTSLGAPPAVAGAVILADRMLGFYIPLIVKFVITSGSAINPSAKM